MIVTACSFTVPSVAVVTVRLSARTCRATTAVVMPSVRYRIHRWEVTPTAVHTRAGWLTLEHAQRIDAGGRVASGRDQHDVGQRHEETRAHADEHVRAQAGRLVAELPVDTDRAAQHDRQRQPAEHLGQRSAGVEELREDGIKHRGTTVGRARKISTSDGRCRFPLALHLGDTPAKTRGGEGEEGRADAGDQRELRPDDLQAGVAEQDRLGDLDEVP